MSEQTQIAAKAPAQLPAAPKTSAFLQRQCGCGGSAGLTGSCSDCAKKKLLGKPLQTKLRISEPGDEYEREADRVAETVMRMAVPEQDNDRPKAATASLVQRKVNASSAGIDAAPPVVHEVLASPGQPLDASTRAFFEPRFGHDFGHVRIHSNCDANESAASLGAEAYAVGRDIVFGSGLYTPFSGRGKALLAHELAHVLQQTMSLSDENPRPFAPSVHRPTKSSSPAIQKWELKNLKPSEGPSAYIADYAELQQRLAAMSVDDRETYITAFLIGVRHRWNRADSLGLIEQLGNTQRATQQMATNPVKPIADLPQNAPQVYSHKINPNVGGTTGTRLGRQLVLDEVKVDKVAASTTTAVSAIMSLRRLDDVLTRVLSAADTAQLTGTPIENVLALYRVEGDLAAPPSLSSLEAGIPSGTTDAAALINPRPDFSHLVWLVAPEVVSGEDDTRIKERALSDWCVQLGGLDEVGLLPQPKQRNFAHWSSRNWLEAEDSNADAWSIARVRAFYDAWNRWSELLDNLVVRRLSSQTGSSEAVMVAPISAEVLISGILSEAVMRHRAGGKVVKLLGGLPANAASPDLTPGLAYLQYNAGQENFKRMLASAAVAASKTKGTRYAPLRQAIAAGLPVTAFVGLLSKLGTIANQLDQDLPREERDQLKKHQAALTTAVWVPMALWLGADPKYLELLSDFVETASPSLWSSWKLPRGNMSRYNVLRTYYGLL